MTPNFDVALLSAPSDGGADAIAAGALGGSSDEAPPNAFAQLLAELSGDVSNEVPGLPGPTVSGASVGEAELVTVAMSASADGWEGRSTDATSDSTEDEQDQVPLTTAGLAGFMMPIVLSEVPDGRAHQGTITANTGAGEAVPIAASESQAAPDSTVAIGAPAEAPTIFDLATLRRDPERADKPGTDASVANDAREARIRAAGIAAIANTTADGRSESQVASAATATRAVSSSNSAVRAEKADHTSPAHPTSQSASAPVSVREASVDSGRQQGEQQPGLSARTSPAMNAEPGGQVAAVVQSFQHALAAATRATGPVVSSSGAVPGDGGALESQIVQGMQRMRRDGVEEVRVTLRPEYLGALTISLRVEQNSVTAVLHVDEPQVRAWVQAHEGLLRQAMSGQGLTLERLVVTDEQPGSENRGRGEEARQGRQRNRGRDGSDPPPTFEVAT